MLKVACILPNLANFCLYNFTVVKIYPLTEGANDLLEKNRKDVVGGSSIVFKPKAFVGEAFNRRSTNKCNKFIGIDAS